MAWVTWRQHRHQLLIGLALIVGLALAALITGLPMRTAYQREALSSCLPPTARSGCDIIVRHFQSEFGSRVDIARYLILLPALVGMFVGAPLLARELEHGTHRFAWTQSVTRRRWLLTKTLLLALAVTLSALVLSAIVTWWRQPFDGLEGRMSPSGFEIQGLVVPAYAVFALALGVLAGAALRRSLAAMSLTLAAFVAVRLAVAKLLRPRYESPEHETMAGLVPGAHARDWVLSNSLVDAVGRHISAAREDLAILHAQQARIDPQEYLLSLGWRRALSFHPADQFWTFQAIEAGIFFAFAAALLVATVLAPAAVAVVTRPETRALDRAQLLKSLGVAAAAIGMPAVAAEAAAGAREPASWSPIPAGASSSSTMRRRIRSSSRPATGSRMRAGTTARPTSGRARRAATWARWSRRCGGRSRAAPHGIAVSVIDRRAFNKPTAEALRRGIPVVSYNADGGRGQHSGSPTSARISTSPA